MTASVGDCFITKDHCNYGGLHFKVTEIMSTGWYRGYYAEWADPQLQSVKMGPYLDKDLVPCSKKAWTVARNAAIAEWNLQASYFISPNASEEEVEAKKAIQDSLKKEKVAASRASKRKTTTRKKTTKTATKATAKKTPAKTTRKKTTKPAETAPVAPVATTEVKRRPRGLAALKAREEAEKQSAGSSQNALNDAIKSMTVAAQEKPKPRGRRRKKVEDSENSLESFI